jgi:hypothetical protein
MNLPSRLGQSFVKRGLCAIAGVGIVGLAVAGLIMHSPTSNSQRAGRATGHSPRFAIDLPIVTPIVSSDLASDLSTTTEVAVKPNQTGRLNSAQNALKEAQVAVSLSQAQLDQARINLREFQAKHDTAKILLAQGKVNRQAAATAKAAYNLAQLQHRSAAIGLKESQAQLIAARSEVNKLGRKANSANEL